MLLVSIIFSPFEIRFVQRYIKISLSQWKKKINSKDENMKNQRKRNNNNSRGWNKYLIKKNKYYWFLKCSSRAVNENWQNCTSPANAFARYSSNMHRSVQSQQTELRLRIGSRRFSVELISKPGWMMCQGIIISASAIKDVIFFQFNKITRNEN